MSQRNPNIVSWELRNWYRNHHKCGLRKFWALAAEVEVICRQKVKRNCRQVGQNTTGFKIG